MSVEIKTLFEAGAHFGHKTSRWHPKMAQYIHSAKSGVHIIDLNKTKELLDQALQFIEDTAASGKSVMLVGTKRQSSDLIEKAAKDTGMPYVSVRWFGGMLTNFKTMNERVKRLKDLESKMESGELASRYNKLEVQRLQEEIDTLNHNFGGIRDLGDLPGALFVADVVTQEIAVKEANKLNLPVAGIVDTNADPRLIDYPIPANDDAIKTQELIIGLVAEAINRGKAKVKVKAEEPKEDKGRPAKTQPSAKHSSGAGAEQKTETSSKKTEAKSKEGKKPAQKPKTTTSKKSAKKTVKTSKAKAQTKTSAKSTKKASK